MNIKEELARLERMTTGELAGRYVEVCGEPARTRNRAYLTRKIAWRLQAQAEGDLSVVHTLFRHAEPKKMTYHRGKQVFLQRLRVMRQRHAR